MPPIVIAGAIAGAATIGGSVLASSSSNRAANTASQTQQNVANQNNALTRENRDFLAARLDPYALSGMRSNALIDSFLFGNQPQSTGAPQGSNPLYGAQNPQIQGGFHNPLVLDGENPAMQNGDPYGGQQQVQGAQGGVTSDLGGWDAFVASPYYQFPLQEGYNGLNQGYAGIGGLRSGAAMKDSIRFGQNYGAGRMDEFLALAGSQANRGVAGASALGGVSQNALAMTTQNNQNAADAASNAALLRGQNATNMYGGIAQGLGNFASSYALYGTGK